jgi:hypothetical protein
MVKEWFRNHSCAIEALTFCAKAGRFRPIGLSVEATILIKFSAKALRILGEFDFVFSRIIRAFESTKPLI